MDKVKAKRDVYNQYTSLINGAITYTCDNIEYVFVNGERSIANLKLISKAMELKSLTESQIDTLNFGLIVVSKNCIDSLIDKMVIKGYDLWIEKNTRQSYIDNATTQDEIDAIVNKEW